MAQSAAVANPSSRVVETFSGTPGKALFVLLWAACSAWIAFLTAAILDAPLWFTALPAIVFGAPVLCALAYAVASLMSAGTIGQTAWLVVAVFLLAASLILSALTYLNGPFLIDASEIPTHVMSWEERDRVSAAQLQAARTKEAAAFGLIAAASLAAVVGLAHSVRSSPHADKGDPR